MLRLHNQDERQKMVLHLQLPAVLQVAQQRFLSFFLFSRPIFPDITSGSFPSVLRHRWLGDRKHIRPVKSWMLVVTI